MKEADTHIHQWRKSSYSGDGSNCVEISATRTTILVRDCKDPAGPRLALLPAAWADFASYAALGSRRNARRATPSTG